MDHQKHRFCNLWVELCVEGCDIQTQLTFSFTIYDVETFLMPKGIENDLGTCLWLQDYTTSSPDVH